MDYAYQAMSMMRINPFSEGRNQADTQAVGSPLAKRIVLFRAERARKFSGIAPHVSFSQHGRAGNANYGWFLRVLS